MLIILSGFAGYFTGIATVALAYVYLARRALRGPRPRGRGLLAAGVSLLLGGCAVVVVHSDGGPPRLSAWPLGVRIERGSSEAFGVEQTGLGFWTSCWGAGVGVVKSWCVVIPPGRCSAAILYSDGKRDAPPAALGSLFGRADFDCLGAPAPSPLQPLERSTP